MQENVLSLIGITCNNVVFIAFLILLGINTWEMLRKMFSILLRVDFRDFNFHLKSGGSLNLLYWEEIDRK